MGEVWIIFGTTQLRLRGCLVPLKPEQENITQGFQSSFQWSRSRVVICVFTYTMDILARGGLALFPGILWVGEKTDDHSDLFLLPAERQGKDGPLLTRNQ